MIQRGCVVGKIDRHSAVQFPTTDIYLANELKYSNRANKGEDAFATKISLKTKGRACFGECASNIQYKEFIQPLQ